MNENENENQNRTKNVTCNFFTLLRNLQGRFFRPLELELKCDISPTQFRTMGIINEKKTITMTELANEILISKQQLTPMIDKLIESNIVERESDPEDRRIIKISLTPFGSEFFQGRKVELLNTLSKRFEKLDPEDIEKLDTALNQINTIINKLD